MRNITVSFVIPTVNNVQLVNDCVQGLLRSIKGTHQEVEVIIVDDGSPPEIQRALGEVLEYDPVHLICKEKNTGFAATVNCGAVLARGEYICLVNNDITFTNDLWLEKMIKGAGLFNAGVVGARLLYPNGLVQHAGVYYLPEVKTFDHEYRFQPEDYGPVTVCKEALAVTGALILIERRLWEELGGMDEKFFIAMEDVDFSLRAWEKGRKVIYQGESIAVHHEGLTRGNRPANKDPYWLKKELQGIEYFFSKWGKKLASLERVYKRNRRFLKKGASLTQVQAGIWQTLTGKKLT